MSIPPHQMFELIGRLPFRLQAVCVSIAAKMSCHVWEAYERQQGLPPLASQLFQIFQKWLEGRSSDDEFQSHADRLDSVVPDNLPELSDPSPGFAGCAIFDIAMIALEKCDGYHYDIFCTAIRYAAAAGCNTGSAGIHVEFSNLTECELRFISDWWLKCCLKVPELSRDTTT